MKEFAKDLKTIYTAPDEKTALKQLESVTQKWDEKYPTAMNRWKDNWDVISPIFKFSADVRTAFYTTNAIESQALLRHSIWLPLNLPRNGLCQLEIEAKFMVN